MNIDLLLDTNVVLYLLKGDDEWQHIIEKHDTDIVGISVITLMELEIGCRTVADRKDIHRFLQDIHTIPLDIPIALRACSFLRQRSRSLRSPHVADAIIAATAAELHLPLLTNNPTDFRRFRGVHFAR